jgi:nicotinamide-nucleotide amidase
MSETLEPALPDHLDEQAGRLIHRICDRKLTVATAESCTGGLLAALLTDIGGGGYGFDRGFVTYTKDSKTELLGIEPSLL